MRLLLALLLLAPSAAAAALQGATPRPNVVLIVADDQRWDDHGFLGSEEVRTPALDGLAARSLVFPRGYVTSPLCRPSLASMVTGLHPHQHGVVANDVDPKRRAASDVPVREAFHRHPSLVRRLVDAGYLAHQSGKWWEGSYADGGFTHGMTHGDPARGGRHGDAGLAIGRQGMAPVTDFVDHALEEGRPFFVWYAPFLPHTPHNPPAELLDSFRAGGRAENVAKYLAMCAWSDATCGELLDHLEARGVLDDTLVVYVVDNGWAPVDRAAETPPGWWPDFAPRSKGSPFEGGVRTPVLVSWPDRIAPGRADVAVSTVDLMPTILAACGVDPPPGLPGVDLLDEAARAGRDVVFGASYAIHDMVPGDPLATLQYRWCVAGDWKLLLRGHGSDATTYRTVHEWDRVPARLWNLRADPHEADNVLLRHPDVAEALRARIDAWLPVPDDVAAPPDEPPVEVVPREDGEGAATLRLPGLVVDFERGHVDVDAVVCLDDGWLELVACTPGTKEHESIVAIEARPMHLHTALLLLGAEPGHPAHRRRGEGEDAPWFDVPARGAPVDLFLVVEDEDGALERPIREFLAPVEEAGARFPTNTFLFTGSSLEEVDEGPRRYLGDLSGHVASLVGFGDEVLGLPDGVAHDAGVLQWRVDAAGLPPVGAPVVLRLRPQLPPDPDEAGADGR